MGNKLTTTSAEPEFCFCSVAFGKRYRALALLLARDLEKYSPDTLLIVLTDCPNDFSNQANVLAVKHQPESVKLYHDKRFAIALALSMYNSCIFVDADMRILAPVPPDMSWLKVPGIAARACDTMTKKYSKVTTGSASAKLRKEFKVTQNVAQKLNLELENPNTKFVHEYLFTVTKDTNKVDEFLKQWEKIAPYFELNGVYNGEGNAIGLAAAKAGLKVRWCNMKGISFFKARTEMIRIKKGQSKMEEMAVYFDTQKNLENPQLSIIALAAIKSRKALSYFYRLVRLRINSLKDLNFYYR